MIFIFGILCLINHILFLELPNRPAVIPNVGGAKKQSTSAGPGKDIINLEDLSNVKLKKC